MTALVEGSEVVHHELYFSDTRTLIRVLTNSLLYASRDSTLPMLASVKFEFDGSRLELMASDRYQAFIEGLPTSIDKAVAPFTFVLSREAVSITLAFLKANRGYEVTITFDTETSLVRFRSRETCMEHYALETKFPNIRSLFPDRSTGKAVKDITFTAAFLANLGRVRSGASHKETITVLTFGNLRPVLIEFLEGPRVLIMPARLAAPPPPA